MTNTLHRSGDAASFHDDYVVFAIPCRGRNDRDCVPKLKRFLQLALQFHPVNLGDARHGGAVRPGIDLHPGVHWKRRSDPEFQVVIDGFDNPTSAAAVFDDRVNAVAFIKAVKEADLGLSVNVSTSVEGAELICHEAGLCRHSLGYSLGFGGRAEKLPEERVLMLSTMCGHGMVSHSLAARMIAWVREGRRTPEHAAACMQRFCSCGVFNPSRAVRILRGE